MQPEVTPPSTPDRSAGGRFDQFTARRVGRALETGRILPFLIGSIVVVVVGFGIVMRIVDSKDFPTIGTAMWWAVSTVTTVGYGDVVPKQPVGRAIAALLMITGFAFLSLS